MLAIGPAVALIVVMVGIAIRYPLIRRLGVTTLVEGADDLTWQGALVAMIDRLKDDPDEQVQKAVGRARRFLRQRGAKVG